MTLNWILCCQAWSARSDRSPVGVGATMLQNVGRRMMVRCRAAKGRPMDGMHHRRDLTPLALALGLFIGTAPVADAADLLGVYVGGAVGQARIDTGNLQVATAARAFNFGTFNENHTAYKLIGGVRAISLIGAEIEYMDFGHPGKSFSLAGVPTSADVRMSGTAAYGMLYLPVPVVSVYVKAGLARLQATSNVS